MIVECAGCQTRFNLDASSIDEHGTLVRCSICLHVFRVGNPWSILATQAETSLRPPFDAENTQFDDSKITQLEELADGDRPPNALHHASTRSDAFDDVEPSQSSRTALETQAPSETPIDDSLSPADEDGYSTAVYDFADWVQPPEAEDEDAGELERDIPGGLGFTDGHPHATTEESSRRVARQTSASSNGPNRLLNAAVTAFVSSILLVGSVATLVLTGRVEPDDIGLQSLWPGSETPDGEDFNRVIPLSTRSFLYPTRFGTEHLVVVGELENRSDEAESNLDVIVELLDHDDEIVASARAPMGLTFNVEEIASIADRRDLEDLMAKKMAKTGFKTIPTMGQIPFMVTLICPPSDVGKLRHRVRTAKSTWVEGSYGLVQ